MKKAEQPESGRARIETDLAAEREGDGTERREVYRRGNIEVARTRGKTEADRGTGGPLPGRRYITLSAPRPFHLLSEQARREISSLFAQELVRLIGDILGPMGSVGILVYGLGNAEMTADALGPETVSLLSALPRGTGDMGEGSREETAKGPVMPQIQLSLLAPGVPEMTGIESALLVAAAARAARADLVLLIDALAARASGRLFATLQIAENGLSPGAGAGRRGSAIDRRTVGLPVIAVGVPTVVRGTTMALDLLSEAGIPEEALPERLWELIAKKRGLFVSLGEADTATRVSASILAEGIAKITPNLSV